MSDPEDFDKPVPLPFPDRPELGRLAKWSVSSHKYGYGVDNLRDGNDNTFWQSEGPQPHVIDLSFPKRVFVSCIALLTSHPRDDSYTPSRISIRAGTGVHDLIEVRLRDFVKPDGWIIIPLRPMDNTEGAGEGPAIPAHHLRIVIIANHLNGKDTHVRGLKIYGPQEHPNVTNADIVTKVTVVPKNFPNGRALLELGHDGSTDFTSWTFKQHAGIR